MKAVNIQQGSHEWHRWRASRFTASDAAAMLGISPYKTRDALLAEKATGIAPEHDAATLDRFQRGHDLEALARAGAEFILGEELYPALGEHDGWDKIAASFDGVTMDGKAIWEHKTLNRELMEAVEIPERHMAQAQQQMLVSGAKSCLFHATDGEGGERQWTVTPDVEWHERIVLGWKQFERDLAAWRPKDAAPPAPQGSAPEALPALRIEIVGKVTASNLEAFRDRALEAVGAVRTELVTDQDFADAEKSIKWCKEAETRLAAAKDAALAQTADIDRLFKTVAEVSEAFRQTRLGLEKSVKAQKEAIKERIVMAALEEFREHLKAPFAEFAKHGLTFSMAQPAFGDAIKGLKTRASIESATSSCLAGAKVATDAEARAWREKLAWLDEEPERAAFREALNLPWIIGKPMDDFKLAVESRINDIRQAEDRRNEAARLAGERQMEAAHEREAATKNNAAARDAVHKDGHAPFPDEGMEKVRAFLRARDFGKEEPRIRAVLAEFVRFCAGQP
jgi:putative phage-type endonuclease